MRFLVIITTLLQSAIAFAECRVYVPEKEFNNSGYTINFDFTKMLHDKNYLEVSSAEEAEYELKLQGIEQEGRFHRAVAVLEMGAYKAEESIVCFTQNCGISDYGKAFNKAYKKLSSIIPHCQ